MIEVLVPQGTRANAGDLVIGFGGVLLDPLRATLSLSDRDGVDEEGTYVTLAIDEHSEFGGWRVSLREIKASAAGTWRGSPSRRQRKRR